MPALVKQTQEQAPACSLKPLPAAPEPCAALPWAKSCQLSLWTAQSTETLHPSRVQMHVPESRIHDQHPIWIRKIDNRDDEVILSSSSDVSPDSSDPGENWETDSDDVEHLQDGDHIHVNTDDSDAPVVFLQETKSYDV